MNRCDRCGKFRSWSVLRFWSIVYQVDIDGHIAEDEWFECGPGKGCRA